MQEDTLIAEEKHKRAQVLGIILVFASILLRIISYPILTNDYTDSIIPWFGSLSTNPGLTAFQYPFSDYPPLYLYFIKILTFLPVNSLYSVKTLSLLGDIFLAWLVYKIVGEIRKDYSKEQLLLVFAVAFAIPTVLVNSSLWGQCDSLYSSFVLLTMYFIIRNRPAWAAWAFGIAIAFKLQAVFFLPILAAYLFTRKKGIAYIFIIPLVYVISILPAVFAGGSFFRYLFIYFHQIGEYSGLSLAAPTMYSFISSFHILPKVQSILSVGGILIGLAAAIFIVRKITRLTYENRLTSDDVIFYSLFCVVLIPFVLPHMHERYFYLADVISTTFALIHPRRWYIPALIVTASFFSYMPFLALREPFFAKFIFNEAVWGTIMFLVLVILAKINRSTKLTNVVS